MTGEVLSQAGRVVVVTGGTGAIGGAIARSLADSGAQVVVISRRVDALPPVEELGESIVGVSADVLDHDALVVARTAILASAGRVDALVNCAGGNVSAAIVSDDASPFEIPVDALRAVVDLNLLGTVLPTQVFGPAIVDAGGGSIVNVSSVGAARALTRIGGYGAAKAGIESYTRWLAVELGRRDVPIRVNAIMPGFFLGEQNRSLLVGDDGQPTERGRRIVERTPLGRLGAPDDLTGTVLWLLSDGSRFVTGIVVPVDGGFTAAAGI